MGTPPGCRRCLLYFSYISLFPPLFSRSTSAATADLAPSNPFGGGVTQHMTQQMTQPGGGISATNPFAAKAAGASLSPDLRPGG